MPKYTNFIRLIIVIAGISISVISNAASFDCIKAKLAKEKLICSDAKLSDLDSQLAELYKKNSKELSPAARQDLLAGQRSWLSYWPKSCAGDEHENKTALAQCAIKKYEKRIDDLKMQRKILGDLTVYRKYKVVANKQSDDDPHYPELDFLTQSSDTIDVDGAPANKKELAKSINLWLSGFQKKASKRSLFYSDKPNLSITLTDNDLPGILAASGTILSQCMASCIYNELHSYFLLAEQRPLLASDIFQAKNWRDALAQMIHKQLEIKYPLNDDINVKSLKEECFYTFNSHTLAWEERTDTSNWNLSRNKFIFEFNFSEIYKYSEEVSVTIPWASLRPWLNPQFANRINLQK